MRAKRKHKKRLANIDFSDDEEDAPLKGKKNKKRVNPKEIVEPLDSSGNESEEDKPLRLRKGRNGVANGGSKYDKEDSDCAPDESKNGTNGKSEEDSVAESVKKEKVNGETNGSAKKEEEKGEATTSNGVDELRAKREGREFKGQPIPFEQPLLITQGVLKPYQVCQLTQLCSFCKNS